MSRHRQMLQLLADARPRRLDPGPRPADPAAMIAHPQDVGGAASAREPRVEGLLAPRPRWPRLRWRLGLTAAVVVAVAAGSLVVESAGRVDEHGRPHAVLPGLPVAAPANAAEALNRAASVAAARPSPTARPDQWFYVELRSPRQGAQTLVSRMWVRADGKQMAGFRGPESRGT